MGNEWKLGLLSDIARFRTVKVAPKEIDVENYISTDNMAPNLGGIVGVSKLPKTGKVTIYKKGDVLFSNIRTYFRKVWLADKDGGCSNDVLVFSPKNTVPSEYLYYILSGNGFINYTVTTAKGTKMPRGDKQAIINYELSIAPKNFMEKIGNTLSTLDNKIQLNRETNKTLEAMAQALFKSWFVDFDPVIDNALAAGNEIPEPFQARAAARKAALAGLPKAQRELFPSEFEETEEMGWVPKGWVSAKLSDLLEVKYGKDHKKLNDGNIPVYGSGGVMRYADKSLYQGESVLIPRKGTLSNILYLNTKFWTVDTMFYTIPQKEFIAKYAYHHLKSLDFTSMNVGSAVPSMTTKVLNNLSILLPSNAILKEFDFILTTYFNKTEASSKQSDSLTKLRDSLLPKLISGELRLPDAEKQFAKLPDKTLA